jgi:hypothetical protein
MEIVKKICCKCNIEKDITEFCGDKSAKDGYTYQCKVCRNEKYKEYYRNNTDKVKAKSLAQRENRQAFYQSEAGILSSRKSHLKRMFGITLEEYNVMSEEQGHVCKICKQPETAVRLNVLSVDHCHSTGKIRGLLCSDCNRGIGLLKDNPSYLTEAAKYLLTHKIK